jgi:imipenem/basic amino acid-specific outer membrane pore
MTSLMIMSINIQANDMSIIENVEGYVRLGYQNTDISGDTDYADMALGGKLHIDTVSWNGISAGASFYTSQSLEKNEGYLSGAGMPFFDGSGKGYSILGEAYLQGQWGNTTVKVGRQEIDTPFADTDDIGMVPNTFEAAVLVNRDIKDTTIVLAHIDRMAGVDAEVPGEFTEINDDNGVQALGISYEGIEGLSLAGWYYNAKDVVKVPYIEAEYETNLEGIEVVLGAQYAYMDWEGAPAAKVFGASLSAGVESTGLTLGAAYNKSSDGAADDLFGGGPFFTSSEHLTLASAGADGEALMLLAEWDAGIAGFEGLTLGAGHLTLEDAAGLESKELDLIASYAFNDALSMDIIYSDIDDKIDSGDKLNNLRVFVNYTF